MNDGRPEPFLTLTEAARQPWLPRRRHGKRPAVTTLWRWAKHGCYGVRLRTASCGATLVTTETWLMEFFEELGRLRAQVAG